MVRVASILTGLKVEDKCKGMYYNFFIFYLINV